MARITFSFAYYTEDAAGNELEVPVVATYTCEAMDTNPDSPFFGPGCEEMIIESAEGLDLNDESIQDALIETAFENIPEYWA